MARSKRKRTSGNDITSLHARKEIVKHQQASQKSATGAERVTPKIGRKDLQNSATRAVSKKLHPASTPPRDRAHRKSLTPLPRRGGISSSTSSAKNSTLKFSSPSPASVRSGRQGETGVGGKGSPLDFSSPALPRRLAPLRRSLNHRSSPLQHARGNPAGVAKLRYLEKIAAWAAAAVPSLGALYGVRLKRTSEAAGISSPVLDSLCERCQTVLHPDVNCSVKSPRAKRRKRRTSRVNATSAEILRNDIQYRCHYCNHDNWKAASLLQEAKTKSAQAAARAQMESEAKLTVLIPNVSCIQEGRSCLSNEQDSSTVQNGQALSTVNDDAKDYGEDKLRAEDGAESLPLQNDNETSCGIRIDGMITDEQRLNTIQRVKKSSAEADEQFVTPPGPSMLVLGQAPSTESHSQFEKPSAKKRKRKGWTSLKAIATSSIEKNLPKPKRLGFLDLSSPLLVRQPK